MTDQPAMPIRGVILQQALDVTTRARNVTYGEPSINLQCAGELKAVYARYAGDKYCEAHDEAIELVLTKIGRIATGQPGHHDTYIDAAAYMAIAVECETKHEMARTMQAASEAWISSQEEIAIEAMTELGLMPVVEDPINLNTALPPEPERHVEPHTPKPSLPVPVLIDSTSPLRQFSDGRVVIKLGSVVTFGANVYDKQEPLWVITRIEDDEFGSFTAQHETNGQTYKGLARHVHRVLPA